MRLTREFVAAQEAFTLADKEHKRFGRGGDLKHTSSPYEQSQAAITKARLDAAYVAIKSAASSRNY